MYSKIVLSIEPWFKQTMILKHIQILVPGKIMECKTLLVIAVLSA